VVVAILAGKRSLTAHQWQVAPKNMAQDSGNREKEETNRKAGIAYAAALSLFAAVVSGITAWMAADRWLGTKPWLLVAGVTLGSVAGFYELFARRPSSPNAETVRAE
jgi:F0F1-type ATP synthase assembly protein I